MLIGYEFRFTIEKREKKNATDWFDRIVSLLFFFLFSFRCFTPPLTHAYFGSSALFADNVHTHSGNVYNPWPTIEIKLLLYFQVAVVKNFFWLENCGEPLSFSLSPYIQIDWNCFKSITVSEKPGNQVIAEKTAFLCGNRAPSIWNYPKRSQMREGQLTFSHQMNLANDALRLWQRSKASTRENKSINGKYQPMVSWFQFTLERLQWFMCGNAEAWERERVRKMRARINRSIFLMNFVCVISGCVLSLLTTNFLGYSLSLSLSTHCGYHCFEHSKHPFHSFSAFCYAICCPPVATWMQE